MDREAIKRVVYQYLMENGHHISAMALRDEIGDTAQEAAETASGQLLSMLDELITLRRKLTPRQQQSFPKIDTATFHPDNRYCNVEYACLQGIHEGNILASRLGTNGILVTSSSDRTLAFTRIEGLPEVVLTDSKYSKVHMDCPILCIDIHPHHPMILIGGMDGSTKLLDFDGTVIQNGPKHRKYVVRVRWSPCGNYFATASYDRTSELWKKIDDTYCAFQAFHFEGNVECVAFSSGHSSNIILDESNCTASDKLRSKERDQDNFCETSEFLALSLQENSDAYNARLQNKDLQCQQKNPLTEGNSTRSENLQLFLCVRGECCLHVFDVDTHETDMINMNELKDDYVSFSAMDCSLSPDGKYVLVATDKDRVLLLSRKHKSLIKVFYGASNGEYSNPRCLWHPSCCYLYATSETNEVIVWETATQKIVHRLQGHQKSIRDMYLEPSKEILITCSYDKTIRFWGFSDEGY